MTFKSFVKSNHILLIFSCLLLVFISASGYAQTSDTHGNGKPALFGESGSGGNGTALPNLFTGTFSYSIPIEVSAGRHGMDPGLALTYSSNKGNGWVGVGWELEVGAIERSQQSGVNYGDDKYVLRLAGATLDLVRTTGTAPGDGEFRAKIESGFLRMIKTGSSWQVFDKTGTQYFFGQTVASRQDDPADATRIFKWCLDQVQDTNGNYMLLSYVKDKGQGYLGQIYLDRIDYTGNSSVSPVVGPTNYVKFYTEGRSDAPDVYTPNFRVRTAYRLKTIDVVSNGPYPGGTRVRAYSLTYTYSGSTSRSILNTVQQYGKNATICTDTTNTSCQYGLVTGGSVLPAIGLTPTAGTNGFVDQPPWTTTAPGGNGWGPNPFFADFDGDGKEDIATPNGGNINVCRSTGSAFTCSPWTTTAPGGNGWGAMSYTWAADFNGDGMADIATANGGNINVCISTGSAFTCSPWTTTAPGGNGWGTDVQTKIGDFDGDGMADIATANGGNINVCKSTGSAFTCSPWTTTAPGGNGWGAGSYTWAADFNGDGKADIATANFGNINVCISTGSTFTCSPWTTTAPGGNGWGADVYTKIGDFNGDGKADIATINGGNINVCISTGSSFTCTPWTTTAPGGNGWGAGSYTWAADFNGDGKTDIATANGGNINVCFSTGSSFTCATSTVSAGNWGTDVFTGPGDFNGDGKIDIASANGGTIWVKQSNAFKVDLLSSISNGIGGTTTIGYTPSTQYSNSCLPFPIQTVSSIATSTPTIDGSTQTSTTTYSYDGGCFYIPERDFRGFNHVTATGPVGPNLEQAITQTWFHQGNDVAVDANVPKVANGYMKGKPYRVLVTDGQGREFSKNEIIYTASNTPPYFNPPYQVDNWTCDGSPCSSGKQTETIYVSYDAYGNPTQEYQKGDVLDQNDDRTILRTFTNNQTPWIVGLPLSETIYKGNGTTNWVAQTNFYYDSAPDCNTASANQTPTVGNLTRVVRWLSQGGGNIETRTAYDSYGNPTCMRDANGNITNISYDSSSTFPKVLTQPPVNQFQLQTTTQYYGIDGVAVDTGLYGQVKSVTDPNGAVTTMTYDVFGRKLQITSPNTLSQTFTYPCVASTGCTPDPTNVFGSVGSQYIKESAVGLFTSTYFDGLNRTIKVKKSGPGGKTIANNQEYNVTGTIKRASLPYFDGIDTPKWQTFIYDAIGRATQTTNPDGSTTSASYTPFVVTGIDASGHQKRETSDAYGHLTKIEEFTGVAPAVTLYATTNYGYDILGNLISVDNNGIKTTMRYDSLKRKIAMSDPDMGSCGDLTTLTPNATFPWYSPPCWNYLYDANGNLIKQIDAQGTQLVFVYDALNRVLRKSFTDLSPPSAPSSPAANAASASQINLSWGAASDNIGIKEYRIERCNYRPGTTACSNFAQITSAPTTSYSNTGLTDGMVYIYRIRAMDTSGNLGGYSSTVSATTPDVTPPNVPNLVVTVFSSNRIDLSWSSIDNVGVTAYELGRCQGAGCTPGVIATNSNTNYFDTQLTPNTSYTYRVRARDAAGNWSSYATVTKSTPVAPADTTPPSVPGSFSATTANPTQVNLTWASSTDNLLLAYYEVERSANNGPYVLVGAPAATNFTDSSATSGVIYFYRVRAVDGAGNKSGYSARDLATTFPFTDDPLISGTTPIKSVHITELRQAVNSLRTFAGLSAATWTDANLTGVPMKPVHIQELRTNLNQALTTLGLLLPNYTDPTITSLVTVRKSVHIQELRQGLK